MDTSTARSPSHLKKMSVLKYLLKTKWRSYSNVLCESTPERPIALALWQRNTTMKINDTLVDALVRPTSFGSLRCCSAGKCLMSRFATNSIDGPQSWCCSLLPQWLTVAEEQGYLCVMLALRCITQRALGYAPLSLRSARQRKILFLPRDLKMHHLTGSWDTDALILKSVLLEYRGMVSQSRNESVEVGGGCKRGFKCKIEPCNLVERR